VLKTSSGGRAVEVTITEQTRVAGWITALDAREHRRRAASA
jgi:hypothetical protein